MIDDVAIEIARLLIEAEIERLGTGAVASGQSDAGSSLISPSEPQRRGVGIDEQ